MSVRAVDVAVHRGRALMGEMEDVDPERWLPDHALHLFVDPMLWALGWDPSDPDECRLFSCGTGLAGYSLSVDHSGSPDLVVLAGTPGVSWAELESWAWPDPGTAAEGVAALTDGSRWLIYSGSRLAVEVDIIGMRRGAAAGILTEWLGRANFG